jgi:hypothetical protein
LPEPRRRASPPWSGCGGSASSTGWSAKIPTGNTNANWGGKAEAQLLALCCGAAPQGHARGTLRLLAARLVELEIVEEISHETVRRTLKKTNSSRGKKSSG